MGQFDLDKVFYEVLDASHEGNYGDLNHKPFSEQVCVLNHELTAADPNPTPAKRKTKKDWRTEKPVVNDLTLDSSDEDKKPAATKKKSPSVKVKKEPATTEEEKIKQILDSDSSDSDDDEELSNMMEKKIATSGRLKMLRQDLQEMKTPTQSSSAKKKSKLSTTKQRNSMSSTKKKLPMAPSPDRVTSNSGVQMNPVVSSGPIPYGFSYAMAVQPRGQRAKCKGCKKTIDYHEQRLRHQFKRRDGKNYNNINQYHCDYACISRFMEPSHLKELKKKKWKES
ncbi:MAG: hypothetical protein SGARI_001029, partial [Bacillariaceae sp.]